MNFGELENLNDSELFDLQNKISEIVKQRNLEKGDLEEIIDNSFNVGFPKVDGLGPVSYTHLTLPTICSV